MFSVIDERVFRSRCSACSAMFLKDTGSRRPLMEILTDAAAFSTSRAVITNAPSLRMLLKASFIRST